MPCTSNVGCRNCESALLDLRLNEAAHKLVEQRIGFVTEDGLVHSFDELSQCLIPEHGRVLRLRLK